MCVSKMYVSLRAGNHEHRDLQYRIDVGMAPLCRHLCRKALMIGRGPAYPCANNDTAPVLVILAYASCATPSCLDGMSRPRRRKTAAQL